MKLRRSSPFPWWDCLKHIFSFSLMGLSLTCLVFSRGPYLSGFNFMDVPCVLSFAHIKPHSVLNIKFVICSLLIISELMLLLTPKSPGSSSCSNSTTLKFGKKSTLRILAIKFGIKFEWLKYIEIKKYINTSWLQIQNLSYNQVSFFSNSHITKFHFFGTVSYKWKQFGMWWIRFQEKEINTSYKKGQ